jgi:hypothetical protein
LNTYFPELPFSTNLDVLRQGKILSVSILQSIAHSFNKKQLFQHLVIKDSASINIVAS